MSDFVCYKGNWTATYRKDFILDPSITGFQKALYLAIKAFVGPTSNTAFPSIRYLARCMGVHTETICDNLKALKEKGLILSNQVHREGKFANTIYTVVEYGSCPENPHTSSTTCPENPGPENTDTVKSGRNRSVPVHDLKSTHVQEGVASVQQTFSAVEGKGKALKAQEPPPAPAPAAFSEVKRFQDRLGGLYGRDPGEQWSYHEESLLAEIVRRPKAAAELEEVIKHHGRLKGEDRRFFPRSVMGLLDRWTSVLDNVRATRQFAPKTYWEKEMEALDRQIRKACDIQIGK